LNGFENVSSVGSTQIGKIEEDLKTPKNRDFFPLESTMGMLDEMMKNQKIIDKIVKIQTRNANIECFIIIIKNVKLKNLKNLVCCMIVCSIVKEIWQSIPASEY